MCPCEHSCCTGDQLNQFVSNESHRLTIVARFYELSLAFVQCSEDLDSVQSREDASAVYFISGHRKARANMPEYSNSSKDIGWEIQQYISSRDGYVKQEVDMKKDLLKPSKVEKFDTLSSPLHDRGHVRRYVNRMFTASKL